MTTSRAARMAIAAGATGWAGFSGSSEMLRALISQASTVRRPYRQGASEQSLIRASDSAAYANSGSPGFQYTGLEVEAGVVSGASVGAPRWYDSVSGGRHGTVTGLPSKQRDSPLLDADASNYIELDCSPFRTILMQFELPVGFNNNSSFIGSANGFEALQQTTAGGRFICRCYTGGSFSQQVVLNGAVAGATMRLGMSISAAGLFTAALYNGTSLVNSGTASGSLVALTTQRFGNGVAFTASTADIYRTRMWDAALDVTSMTAVVTGGGATPVRDFNGLRAGIFNPLAPSELPIASGAGLPVLAP